MVCLGNICRSPTAQGVLENLVVSRGLQHIISVDSAGTSAWHINEPPDKRSQHAALQRGYDLSNQRGRQVQPEDFYRFDYILAMDKLNLIELQRMRPKDFVGHLGLFLDFYGDPRLQEVPDPYHGGHSGFDRVLDLIETASRNFLEHLVKTRNST